MRVEQFELTLEPRPRGFHLVTGEVERALRNCTLRRGIVHLFLRHTSASLCINENCDPDVRGDMERFFSDAVDGSSTHFDHTCEGADDMPAHIKSAMMGVSLAIPLKDGRLGMGTWQGIYLNEHRSDGGRRSLLLTVMGEA